MTMRALVLRDGFGVDRLTIEERPEPAPGPGEARVRVRAASLNYRDLLMVRGDYDPRLPLPAVPGSDAAGEVTALGEGVTRFEIGDRVCPIFARGWHDGPAARTTPLRGLGGRVGGTFVESIVANAEDLVHAPSHLDDREAATLGAAGVTAYRALFGITPVEASSTVLVIGTGGVSLYALQLARAVGARCVVVSRSREKLERALSLGGSEGVNATTTPEWGRAVRRLTRDRGVDLVVEVGGAGTLAESIAAVRPGGTIALVGTVATVAASPSLVPIVMREIRMQGLLVGPRTAYEALVRFLEAHALRPVIDSEFSLERFREAFQRLESDEHFGKICLTM
jgi:NADPH:quinone reductase-like Zn-dependent oxidoreductase